MDQGQGSRRRRNHKPTGRRPPPPEATGREAQFIAEKKERRAPLHVQMRDGQSFRGHIEYFDRDMVKIVPDSGPTVFVRKNQIRLIEEL